MKVKRESVELHALVKAGKVVVDVVVRVVRKTPEFVQEFIVEVGGERSPHGSAGSLRSVLA